jgi:Domain of unknown function (DUF1924)
MVTSSIHRLLRVAAALSLVMLLTGTARAVTPQEQLAAFSAAAGTPAEAAKGQKFFTSTHGREWSCSSCHGALPTGEGKHAATGKVIGPLAPAFNANRFADSAKTEKWFRRNCNDVLGRECRASEKADVLAWLLSIQR